MPDTPIIKVFMPDFMEQSAQAKLESIKTKLQDDDIRQQVIDALNEYGVKALIIAPDHSPTSVDDTGAELLSFFLSGNRPLTDLAQIRLGRKIGEVLDEGKILGVLPFDRSNEQGWLEEYKIMSAQQNPVTQVFAELDVRKADNPGSERS